MKTNLPRLLRPAALAAGLLAAAAPALHADSYLFSEGGTGVSVPGATSQNFNIRDTAIYEATPGDNHGTSISLQSSMNNILGQGQSIQLYAFDGITFNDPAETILNATLHLNLDFVFPTGGNTTWNIVGITAPWNESAVNWTNFSSNVTGGAVYGSFSDTSFDVEDTYYGINITSALTDYLAGNITGIAFVNNGNGTTFTASDRAIVFNSSDNTNAALRPGLAVTTAPVPEPSGVILAGLTGLLAFRRRRSL